MQDVVYGRTKLKFDSGGTKTIPNAVLTAKYSLVIASYVQRCSESNSKPCLKEHGLDYCST